MDIIKEFKSHINCSGDLSNMEVELKHNHRSTNLIVLVGDYRWSEYIPREITSNYLEQSAHDFIRNWSVTTYITNL